ncbi:hypothetical protein FIBSPDRAFT_861490 [Athelia psychrophila]|uniref:Uncharacterized protein n=1 Tax=Athelia psychrophila TaxID=1759441 RepID=A0A166J472_9AGAM|nr:hypothetical protein FIBSPDRAFT_861490 [Fibularhizoctonia sp. CBS 109695]
MNAEGKWFRVVYAGRSRNLLRHIKPTAYSSPPSPQFNAKHLYAPPIQRTRSQPSELFGILDAPLVMHPDAYAHEKPLSPPLTSPLSTLSLPEPRTQLG